MDFADLERRAPSAQTALDVFNGRWSAAPGGHLASRDDLARACHDPALARAIAFHGGSGRLAGFYVLDLSPHEGAHSYQLEQAGANVRVIEASPEDFLKCLVTKEVLELRARFQLGNAAAYLQDCNEHFDLVSCIGLLEELANPLELIKQIALHSKACILAAKYHPAGAQPAFCGRLPRLVSMNGFQTTAYERSYCITPGKLNRPGGALVTALLESDEILRAFHHFGMTRVQLIADDRDHADGPSAWWTISRS